MKQEVGQRAAPAADVFHSTLVDFGFAGRCSNGRSTTAAVLSAWDDVDVVVALTVDGERQAQHAIVGFGD